jgi:hypothetical protein
MLRRVLLKKTMTTFLMNILTLHRTAVHNSHPQQAGMIPENMEAAACVDATSVVWTSFICSSSLIDAPIVLSTYALLCPVRFGSSRPPDAHFDFSRVKFLKPNPLTRTSVRTMLQGIINFHKANEIVSFGRYRRPRLGRKIIRV